MDANTARRKYGIRVGSSLNHPMFGIGEVTKVLAEGVELRWTNPYHRIKAPKIISEAEITFMTKVITEEKTMKNKKVVLEFDLPDAKDTTFTATDPMSKGTASPLATLDGEGGSPGVNWKPSMSSDPKDAPSAVKVAGKGEGKVSVPAAKSSAPKSSPSPKSDSGDSKKGNPFAKKEGNPFAKKEEESSEDNKEKRVEEMQFSWEDANSLLGEKKNEQSDEERRAARLKNKDKDKAKQARKDEVDECNGKPMKESDEMGDDMGDMNLDEHDMAAGEIAVTQELLKAILQTAVKDQPDDAAIDKIVSGFASCCGEDRTLDVSDIPTIMSAIKGEAAPAGDDMADEDVSPADGETAGPEGGEEHEGKDMLMAGQKAPLAKMAGRPGQKFPNAIKPSYVKQVHTESKKAPAGKGKKKLDEAWLTAIPNAGVVNGRPKIEINEEDDEDTLLFKQIAHRAGVTYKS